MPALHSIRPYWFVIAIIATSWTHCSDDMETAEVDGDAVIETDSPSPLTPCEGSVTFDYEPLSKRYLGAFPDDVHTAPSAETPSGRTIAFRQGFADYLAEQEEAVGLIYGHLEGLDGWGIAAPAMLRFTDAIEDIDTTLAGVTTDPIQLWNIDGSPPYQVPLEVRRTESTQALMLWPLIPLAPTQRHAIVVTHAFRAANGECIAPGEVMDSLLRGTATEEALEHVAQNVSDTLIVTGLEEDQVAALTTFTTQTTIAPSEMVMEEIRAAPLTWSSDAICTEEDQERVCERRFMATDYRLTSPGRQSWELSVTTWLPANEPGPYPTMVFGHGINSNRQMAREAVDALRGLGVAITSVDAVAHGDHPTSEGLSGYEGVLVLLGIDAMAIEVDGRKMRDNFLQSSFDKLQLIEVLKADGDIDQDGEVDVDLDAMGYIGFSLGAIMGSQVLALSDDMKVGALLTPGARLTDILAYADRMSVVMTILDGITGARDATFEALSAVQTATDPGDAGAFAGHVLDARLNDAAPPHLLAMQVIGDNTVPATTTRALTWALGVPQLQPIVEDIPMVAEVSGPSVSGNLNGGQTTGALFQFDRVHYGEELFAADHDGAGRAREIAWQLRTFIESWMQEDMPRIEDPYAALGTPPLNPR